MKELAFIGDVHGCLVELEEVVGRALPRAARLIFLGDYVNRGPRTREVIDYLVRLSRSDKTKYTFLRGNHDEAFLDTLTAGSIDTLLHMGGATTIASYVPEPRGDVLTQLRQSVPDSHLQFLRNLAPYLSVDNVFAVHDPSMMNEITTTAGKFGIYGHLPQRSGKPTICDTEAFIDTGCGTTKDGRLTCLFWPSLEWFQST